MEGPFILTIVLDDCETLESITSFINGLDSQSIGTGKVGKEIALWVTGKVSIYHQASGKLVLEG